MSDSLLLPKGIVVNSEQIGESIGSIDTQPLDQAEIAKLWKVYTTTQRRLLDPTAERLEAFWWRLWGSRSRQLNGAVVARLFMEISDGETFVPLRGPPNRIEGASPSGRSFHRGPGASSTTAIHQPSQVESGPFSPSSASKAPVPMPHPILKKTRGPSMKGSRPTARFISPHDSEDDTSPPNSSISPNSHVVVQPPSPVAQDVESERKSVSTLVKKKGGFVAHKKKRPVIIRRQSSQSSAEKVSESSPSSAAMQSSSDRTPPAVLEQARAKGPSKFQENFSPAERPSGTPSPQKKGPRTADVLHGSSRRPAGGRSKSGLSEELEQEATQEGVPGPSGGFQRMENHRDPVKNVNERELELQRILLEQAAARRQRSEENAEHPHPTSGIGGLKRSASTIQNGSEVMGAMRFLPHEANGTASQQPTLAAATGQVNLGSMGTPETGSLRREDKGKGRDSGGVRPADMFAKRPVQPVQSTGSPNTSSSDMARSKSQLTLLLEKNRVRSSDNTVNTPKRGGRR